MKHYYDKQASLSTWSSHTLSRFMLQKPKIHRKHRHWWGTKLVKVLYALSNSQTVPWLLIYVWLLYMPSLEKYQGTNDNSRRILQWHGFFLSRVADSLVRFTFYTMSIKLTIDTSWGSVFRLVNGSAFCSSFIISSCLKNKEPLKINLIGTSQYNFSCAQQLLVIAF